jgi:tRNA(fMet)-specific endonuclease VapC
MQSLIDLLSDVDLLEVNHEVARKFGAIRAALLDQGKPTPDLDLLIAATALEHNLILVTHNVQDFANIPGLTVQDWLIP